jgi:lipid-A-disaccharide synthase
MKPFTFWLAQKLVKTPYVSLPNLLAGREIVTELLQHDCVPDKLAAAVMPLLEESPETDALKQTFLTLHQSIRCGADEQAAQAVLELAKA